MFPTDRGEFLMGKDESEHRAESDIFSIAQCLQVAHCLVIFV